MTLPLVRSTDWAVPCPETSSTSPVPPPAFTVSVPLTVTFPLMLTVSLLSPRLIDKFVLLCALSALVSVIVSTPSVPVVSMTTLVLFQNAAVSMVVPPDVPDTRIA